MNARPRTRLLRRAALAGISATLAAGLIAPSADAADSDKLFQGGCMTLASVFSASRTMELRMQSDGNLVLYRVGDRRVLWSSNTWDPAHQYAVCVGKGALTIESFPDRGRQTLWRRVATFGSGGFLKVQDDGKIVAYTAGNRPVAQSCGFSAWCQII